jgi:hypothetical protein
MSKIFHFLLIIILINACKSDETAILYTESMSFCSNNILSENQSDSLLAFEAYCFGAKLEKDASLKIVLKNTSDWHDWQGTPAWFYDMQSNRGWIISDYNYAERSQVFIADKSGELTLTIMFISDTDSFPSRTVNALIEYYENGEILSKSKELRW